VLAQIAQVKAAVNATEKVVRWNNGLKVETVKQPFLPPCLLTHHLEHLLQTCDMHIIPRGVFQHHQPERVTVSFKRRGPSVLRSA
jgi:hypothetical protein